MSFSPKHFLIVFFLLVIFASNTLACACGDGMLNVGTSSLIPSAEGGTAFLQYDSLDQTRNWHKRKKSDADNHDKRITTQTTTVGMQYMFNRDFGAAIRIPHVTRSTVIADENEILNSTRTNSVGDISLNGIYSGFFADMSTGIIFGLKLPTGQTNARGLQHNMQIGTGSTDSILGAYHRGNFGKKTNLGFFLQTAWKRPFISHPGYTPGSEISGATGIYYNSGRFGAVKKLAPILQVIGVKKGQDSGMTSISSNQSSGYTQMFFAPGIEFTINDFKFYADVEFPIYRAVNGNQLMPQNLYKMILGYNF